MSRSEVIIHTKPLTRDEEHKLIALIVRCGYSVYVTYDDSGRRINKMKKFKKELDL
jgi:hypothetical protein